MEYSGPGTLFEIGSGLNPFVQAGARLQALSCVAGESVFQPLQPQREYMETTEDLDATEVHIQGPADD